jgi:dUTP pyrophosphatase
VLQDTYTHHIAVKQTSLGARFPLPIYQTSGASGLDLVAALEESISLTPGERQLVPTGLMIALPQGLEAQVRPRSGLAFKNGVTVLNTPGTIDADYRGEIKALLINHGKDVFTIQPGDRIAQLVIAPVHQVVLVTGAVDETARGDGGFGSTGVSH